MRNHASRGLADAFILGSTQGWSEFRHGLNSGEAEHCLRCCAGTSSSLSSFLDGSGDIGKGLDPQAELDAFCSHRGSHGGGHRSGQVAGVPVWLQKATRRDSFVCIFKILYIHTRVCMCICRNCLVFALYLWQKHNYFSFSKLCPFTGKPEYRQLFLFVFNCILHAEKLGLQKNSSYSVWGGGNRVRSWLTPISQLPVVWSIRSLLAACPGLGDSS